MNKKDIIEMTKCIINGYLVNCFLHTSPMTLSDIIRHPNDWYIIQGTKKKLGKNHEDYIGIRLIYSKYTLDDFSGTPSDQILDYHEIDRNDIDKFINKLVKDCFVEKKLSYKEGDKRLIYELFIKKTNISKIHGLLKITGAI